MAQNYASVFSTKIDERFTRESQAAMALNNDYKFTGVKTVNVYSIPVAPMGDYTRSGVNRYGTPSDLGTEVQALTINRDRSWTFIIDKGDKIQSQMVLDAGKAVSRQMSEVIVPEDDKSVVHTLAKAACAKGNTDTTAATKTNAELLSSFDKFGSVDAGKFADIVAFKKNPLTAVSSHITLIFEHLVLHKGIVCGNSICEVFSYTSLP